MFTKNEQITKWIVSAETDRDAAAGNFQVNPDGGTAGTAGYKKNREYYENYQKPSGVPDDVQYVVRDLITDFVNRFVAKLIGSKVGPTFFGAGMLKEAVSQLMLDILDENKFHELLLEDHGNMFAVEGATAWKCLFDPFELCNYGLGKPTIYNLYYDEFLLDPNARSGSHSDDLARAFVKRMLLDETIDKWGRDENGTMTEMGNQIGQTFQEDQRNQTEKFVKIYWLEFIKKFMVPHVVDMNGQFPSYRPVATWNDENQNFVISEEGKGTDPDNIIPIRLTKYFSIPVINQNVFPEKAKLSGYNGFTVIPSLHTYRRSSTRWPMCGTHLQVDTQDQINVLESEIMETSKASAKNSWAVTAPGGVQESDIATFKRKIGGIAQLIAIKKGGAQLHQLTSQIPPVLAEMLQLKLQAFDDTGSTGDPDRGQGEIQRSGRAEIALQTRADIPLVIPQLHLTNSITELFLRLTEMIVRKMTKPFSIDREIDGNEQQIKFNYPATGEEQADENGQIDEYHVISEKEGKKIINSLAEFKPPRVKVEVEMNVINKENVELQKAMALRELQGIAMIDVQKAFYPKRWQEINENWKAESPVAAFMQQLTEMEKETPGITQKMMQLVGELQQQGQIAEEVASENAGSNGKVQNAG